MSFLCFDFQTSFTSNQHVLQFMILFLYQKFDSLADSTYNNLYSCNKFHFLGVEMSYSFNVFSSGRLAVKVAGGHSAPRVGLTATQC